MPSAILCDRFMVDLLYEVVCGCFCDGAH
jgi:hypothetical protein